MAAGNSIAQPIDNNCVLTAKLTQSLWIIWRCQCKLNCKVKTAMETQLQVLLLFILGIEVVKKRILKLWTSDSPPRGSR